MFTCTEQTAGADQFNGARSDERNRYAELCVELGCIADGRIVLDDDEHGSVSATRYIRELLEIDALKQELIAENAALAGCLTELRQVTAELNGRATECQQEDKAVFAAVNEPPHNIR